MDNYKVDISKYIDMGISILPPILKEEIVKEFGIGLKALHNGEIVQHIIQTSKAIILYKGVDQAKQYATEKLERLEEELRWDEARKVANYLSLEDRALKDKKNINFLSDLEKILQKSIDNPPSFSFDSPKDITSTIGIIEQDKISLNDAIGYMDCLLKNLPEEEQNKIREYQAKVQEAIDCSDSLIADYKTLQKGFLQLNALPNRPGKITHGNL